jgi:FMN phosphatase YigB (HAD superfamily)
MNKLVIFDLDGTLTESKAKVTPEIVQAISNLQQDLLGQYQYPRDVAVISGCAYEQFQKQFISEFDPFKHRQDSLFLMPTCGAQLYEYAGYDGGWYKVYGNDLLLREKALIYSVFERAIFAFNADIKRHKGAGFSSANIIDKLDAGH